MLRSIRKKSISLCWIWLQRVLRRPELYNCHAHLSQLIKFAPPPAVTIDKKFSVKLHRLETCRWHFPTKLRNYCGWPKMASWKCILVKVHFHLRLTAGLILPHNFLTNNLLSFYITFSGWVNRVPWVHSSPLNNIKGKFGREASMWEHQRHRRHHRTIIIIIIIITRL